MWNIYLHKKVYHVLDQHKAESALKNKRKNVTKYIYKKSSLSVVVVVNASC